MKNVGFHGGHTVYECATSLDMYIFFQCIAQFASAMSTNLLTDELYRRYLEKDDLYLASEQALQVEALFSRTLPTEINWEDIDGDIKLSTLCLDKDNLAIIFSEHFKNFHNAIKSAESFYHDFGTYIPVKTVISDLPWFIEDKNRPLEQYDALGPDDLPFWLR
ncbi:hypothetical protein LW347_00420 [Pectobacterium polonicum]|uniref:DUF4240 domain-containing protein n=1 Tax=Pectobacterium polonicum TaxID=2485124 RepID=A0AAE9SXE5_9GAMM|nr:hypothetical protein [Pectobacterium polonicum]UVO08513.1 hypothetical protein LW347_00420 [Pectobacterium polonicum]